MNEVTNEEQSTEQEQNCSQLEGNRWQSLHSAFWHSARNGIVRSCDVIRLTIYRLTYVSPLLSLLVAIGLV
jgi:hypothetical protein